MCPCSVSALALIARHDRYGLIWSRRPCRVGLQRLRALLRSAKSSSSASSGAMSSGIRSSSSCTRTHAHAATHQSPPRMPVGYGHVGWAALFPTQHRIPRDMVSHKASYPTRHGIPHSTVSAPNRLQNRALIGRPSRRASCARLPEGLHDAPVARAMLHVACVAPVRVVTAWSPRCRRARRRSARGGPHGVCWWVGQAKRRAVSAASGVGGSRAGEHCGPLLVSTSSHPAQLPSASPLPSLKGYSKRCSLSNPDPPRA